jgi:hypothetical protein
LNFGLNISVLAKSAIAILAVVVLMVFLGAMSTNSSELLDTGKSLFGWIVLAILGVTLIINLPRILRTRH